MGARHGVKEGEPHNSLPPGSIANADGKEIKSNFAEEILSRSGLSGHVMLVQLQFTSHTASHVRSKVLLLRTTPSNGGFAALSIFGVILADDGTPKKPRKKSAPGIVTQPHGPKAARNVCYLRCTMPHTRTCTSRHAIPGRTG